jgi:plastocyanin
LVLTAARAPRQQMLTASGIKTCRRLAAAPMLPVWVAVLCACLLAASGLGHAAAQQSASGVIRGRVQFPGRTAPDSQRPAVGALGTSDHTPAVDRARSVVYLDAVLRRAFEELPAGRVRMDQRNEQFVPRLLAITVGTIVQFDNHDTKFHNVFSLSKTHPFDLGRNPPGKSGAERFERPGLVRVFCDIHSHMSGYIWVFSHPYFAVTDTDGRYAISRVPPGGYTLMVWSELGAAEPRRVTVADGGTTEIDFDLSRGR